MTTDARTCWYQKHDLLACAARHGFSVTESRFDEWVERGLMGEAQMRVRPGCGSSAWWPHAQLTLFLDLLAFRQRISSTFPFRQLYHLPVWRWLYWGELGGVTLKQVRRAVSTWVDLQQKIPGLIGPLMEFTTRSSRSASQASQEKGIAFSYLP